MGGERLRVAWLWEGAMGVAEGDGIVGLDRRWSNGARRVVWCVYCTTVQ